MLAVETISIVEATAPDVHAKAASIIFRMWHHVPTQGARRLPFAEFALEGRVLGLLEAIAAAMRRTWLQTLPRLLTPTETEGASSLYAKMEPALLHAWSEVLGKRAAKAVSDAWQLAFRSLAERFAV